MYKLAVELALLLSPLAFGQSAAAGPPQIVEFTSSNLSLKGYLWKPPGRGPFPAVLCNHGSGGTDAMHTAGMPMGEAAEVLAAVFVKHGYAFFFPCRRGHGLSADQAEFMQDALNKQEVSGGIEARNKLQFALLTGPYLDDTLAALSFLKTVRGVDAHRIAVVGHSFGGQLALLDAERDNTLEAVVVFGAAANSWEKSREIRERLLTAVKEASAPIMLIHAANDYGTSAGRDLAAELDRLHRSHVLMIYPASGKTADDGHNAVYNSVSMWESDVFDFLRRPPGGAPHVPRHFGYLSHGDGRLSRLQ